MDRSEKLDGEQRYTTPYLGMHSPRLDFQGVVSHKHPTDVMHCVSPKAQAKTFLSAQAKEEVRVAEVIRVAHLKHLDPSPLSRMTVSCT